MPNVLKDVTSVHTRGIYPGCSMSNLSQRGKDGGNILEELLASHPTSGLGLQGADETVHLSPHSEIIFFVQLYSPKTSLLN